MRLHSDYSQLRVAIVTDWMYGPGGSDRFVTQVLKLFPNAELFTAYYNSDSYFGRYEPEVKVNASFIQKLPLTHKLYRHYSFLAPLAFESMNFTGYDLVISLSAGPAKGVITAVDQPHISIILTPPRSLWDGESNVRASKLKGLYRVVSPLIAHYLRVWDRTAFERANLHLSISNYIAKKVVKIYGKETDVVYPGIDDWWFEPPSLESVKGENQKPYFLVVSRLYDYKRVDWAIKACMKNELDLLIVGEGPDRPYLETRVGDRIRFLGFQPDDQLKQLYKNAEALIFPGEEDYGYTPLEAMSQGTPVIAFNRGGVTETVVEGITGEFFGEINELSEKLAKFDKLKYNEKAIVENAKRFSEKQFRKDFIKQLDNFYAEKQE